MSSMVTFKATGWRCAETAEARHRRFLSEKVLFSSAVFEQIDVISFIFFFVQERIDESV